mmetsp:Transcript_121249/g.343114  ORF Transcript_121249/g.343114 Transcript_121249/m.343114 type:complete len:210 (-) Transcript_121249:101-730(-)
MPGTALDITDGITDYTGRTALMQLFSQFGKVTACWIPPADHRSRERTYVKFATTQAAQAALDAARAGMIYNHGIMLRAEWRTTASKTADARDFDAAGSNLMTSRDIFRAAARQRKDSKKEKKNARGGRSRSRSRSRGRDRRSRSGDRKRRSRSRNRGRSESRRRSRSRSRGRGRGGDEKGKNRSEERSPLALEDGSDRREEPSATSALI